MSVALPSRPPEPVVFEFLALRNVRKEALLELLLALVETRPEERAAEGFAARCHFCGGVEGYVHEDGCSWIEARVLLADEEALRDLRVGQEEDGAEDERVTTDRTLDGVLWTEERS